MSKSQDPYNAIKAYSKDCSAYISVGLLYAFISTDQIEIRSCALFAAGNGDWGAIYGRSFCTRDIAKNSPSHDLCAKKLNKGLDYLTCTKCLN